MVLGIFQGTSFFENLIKGFAQILKFFSPNWNNF